MKTHRWTEAGTLALCIALFPPIWAVLAPYIGVTTGSVALITAGLYVAHGNSVRLALPITVGFLLGDLWAVLAVHILSASPLPPNASLFLTLFVLGGLAVLLSAAQPRWIDTPAWLCGWAIGLTVLSPLPLETVPSLAVQVAVAMAVGVWYVGVFVGTVQQWMARRLRKE